MKINITKRDVGIILVGMFLVSAVFSSGYIWQSSIFDAGVEINATSGSPSDIQSAINQASASGGGIVHIPEGDFTFNFASDKGVTIPGGVSIIGVGSNRTVLHRTSGIGGSMFYLDGSNGKPSRISGIYFHGYIDLTTESGCVGLTVFNAKDFRVDNNVFMDFASSGVFSLKGTGVHRGVIDHNVFDNLYKEENAGSWQWGYGVNVQIYDSATRNYVAGLPLTYYLGKYDDNIIFIEDNVFTRCRYAVASNTGTWYVLRHNDITVCPLYNTFAKAGTDVHEGGLDYPGGKGIEAYNNIIRRGRDYGDQGFKLRAGSGVIHDNTIINVGTAFWLLKVSWATQPRNYVHDLYIWGNTLTGVATQVSADPFYVENTHYFLRVPTVSQDGITYAEYQWPHPLVTSEPLPTPTSQPTPPPPSLQPSESPTPIPTPTSNPLEPAFTPPSPPEPTGFWLIDMLNDVGYFIRWTMFGWIH